jgi:LysR family transcriptional regulator, transcriptional activator of nhaA
VPKRNWAHFCRVPAINYQHLQYFWVVAREGSIARATKVLGLTQPTISVQIHALERVLGEQLFARRGRNLVLTDVGRTVYHYADEIFSLGKELSDALEGRPSGRPLRFAVGLSDSLPKLTAYRLLEPALTLTNPALHVVVRTDKVERLLAELSIHALDLVLSDTPVAPTLKLRAFSHPLGESTVTVFGADALARKYRRNFPQSLDGAPFLLHGESSALRRSFEQFCAKEGIRPTAVAEIEDVAILQVFGQQGLGLFAAPTVAEVFLRKQYSVQVVGRLPTVKERFFAISADRKYQHPGIVAISEAARTTLDH